MRRVHQGSAPLCKKNGGSNADSKRGAVETRDGRRGDGGEISAGMEKRKRVFRSVHALSIHTDLGAGGRRYGMGLGWHRGYRLGWEAEGENDLVGYAICDGSWWMGASGERLAGVVV